MSKSYEELVAAAQAAIGEGEFIEFEGMNCNDYMGPDDGPPCPGWDGKSRRCACGNRRVYWTLERDGESVYAVAD